jgi:hypothetical protein
MMQRAAQSDSHLPHLDGMRAVLALYVAVHHCYLSIWPIDRGAGLPGAAVGRIVNWLLFGRLAVAGFIAVSGYCLMLPVARGDGILRGGGQTVLSQAGAANPADLLRRRRFLRHRRRHRRAPFHGHRLGFGPSGHLARRGREFSDDPKPL